MVGGWSDIVLKIEILSSFLVVFRFRVSVFQKVFSLRKKLKNQFFKAFSVNMKPYILQVLPNRNPFFHQTKKNFSFLTFPCRHRKQNFLLGFSTKIDRSGFFRFFQSFIANFKTMCGSTMYKMARSVQWHHEDYSDLLY